ncbi:hypothetical protein LNP04_00985 [Chryseobacterium sp. C-71]|uniref:hypothetical protein n=1 Tax=Chryseobacterium sp. C-71 TaxID=2893882 RepID=UPI001E42C611|nr:hypothetical protein [Chryseobacterium sp. C-71]UFH32309.1 hypothetical protein LNP04_00985 [Chryseobacterium sp. C-71]
MKLSNFITAFFFKTIAFLSIFWGSMSYAKTINNEDPNQIINEMCNEISLVYQGHFSTLNFHKNELAKINLLLKVEKVREKKIDFLIRKDELQELISQEKDEIDNEISKIRYIKGLQIIKILYEKILGLDHHFASVRTFSEISKIANPNQYPEFEKVKDLIKNKQDKKVGFDLTKILGTNTLASVINTFTGMIVSNLSKQEKETELLKVDCIIDFTLRMQNDLNTIYFETAFLQKSNETVKSDLENLFRDYTKPIGYEKSLKDCREGDDWTEVKDKLETFITTIAKSDDLKKRKLQIEVEFPIDRLIQFIGTYNNFISSGEQFYQKFKIILNSYENEKQCESKLPIEYAKLKSDIGVAIEKFNIAYKPVEINGTKMKEILYGINEFQ